MSKAAHRARRKHSRALPPRDSGRPIDRLLSLPHLARVVPHLQPELLHQVVQHCGLEDSGELLTLATPAQLERVLDLDLWPTVRSKGGEVGEVFDADRFGVWLEVLVDAGPEIAARTLSAIGPDLVTAGIARHARVFDRASVTPYTMLDGAEVVPMPDVDSRSLDEVGGYSLLAMRTDSWHAVVTILGALATHRPDYFNQVMRGCVELSSSKPENDGLDELLDASDQICFDVAFDREQRREKQGYVPPAQARAFLEAARRCRPAANSLAVDPIVRAYFRSIDRPPAALRDVARLHASEKAPVEEPAEVAAVVAVLAEAGVIAQPRALLVAASDSIHRLALIHAQLEYVLERDPLAYSKRQQELGFLANAIASGSSIFSRALSPREASDAAVAVCNLGLENWSSPSDDLLLTQDLVGVFQAGWSILYDVSMNAAEQLIAVLFDSRSGGAQTLYDIDVLRIELAKHWRAGTPWNARPALDALAALNMPAWAALVALLDEFPVLHGAVAALRDRSAKSVGAADFEFIAENSQIAGIREFLESLPELLE